MMLNNDNIHIHDHIIIHSMIYIAIRCISRIRTLLIYLIYTLYTHIILYALYIDVPADGYSVELGQLEPPESRGQVRMRHH